MKYVVYDSAASGNRFIQVYETRAPKGHVIRTFLLETAHSIESWS